MCTVVVGSQILPAQNVTVSVEVLCRGSSVACSCGFVVKFAVNWRLNILHLLNL